MADALAVRDGLYPPMEDDGGLAARPSRCACGRCSPTCPRPTPPRGQGCHHGEGRARRRRRARLLRAGLPLPDRRLSHARSRRGSTTCRSRRCSWARPAPCAAPRCAPIAEFMRGRDQRTGDAARRRLRHRALPAPGAARLSGHDAEGPRPVAALSRRGARGSSSGLRGAELIEARGREDAARRRQRRHRHRRSSSSTSCRPRCAGR